MSDPIGGADLVLKIPKQADDSRLLDMVGSFMQNENTDTLILQTDEQDRIWQIVLSGFLKVEAAGGVVFNDENCILMIFRNGKWDLPKGKLEDDELPSAGAIREVEEECGVSSLEILKPIESTFHAYYLDGKIIAKETHWFEMKCFGCPVLVPQLAEGITEVKWWSRDALSVPLSNTYASVASVIKPYTDEV